MRQKISKQERNDCNAQKAKDTGHKMVCMMDPVMCQTLNPKIQMSRSKKLILGHKFSIFESCLKGCKSDWPVRV